MSEIHLPTITLRSKIQLNPISQQFENGVLIVGYGDQFLELPPEGARFIEWLNEGCYLAVARARFETLFNPFPDDELMAVMDAFLEAGFIAAVDGRPVPPRHPAPSSSKPRFPRKWARALFSTPVLIAWILFVIPAALILFTNGDFWPKRSDYFWIDAYFVIVLAGLIVGFSNLAVHECFHWLASRAKGIEATMTWGHRLGFLPVAQTVMHNIWAVPRAGRYLPIAAGMMWDVFLMSLWLYLLFANKIGLLAWSPLALAFLRYLVLTAVLTLAAQFWLFTKMDGYYLLSALFGQRNLQADTLAWIKSKLPGKQRSFDPPAGGMTFVYLYALILVVGGSLFLGQFLLINLPIKLQLLWVSFNRIADGAAPDPMTYADGIAILTSQALYWGLLAYVHGRKYLPRWNRRATTTLAPAHTLQ